MSAASRNVPFVQSRGVPFIGLGEPGRVDGDIVASSVKERDAGTRRRAQNFRPNPADRRALMMTSSRRKLWSGRLCWRWMGAA